MVAHSSYEAYRRSAESTSRDQTGELQPMTQVGPHAPALFAAQAGSAERADYTLNGIAELYAVTPLVARRLAGRRSVVPRCVRARPGGCLAL